MVNTRKANPTFQHFGADERNTFLAVGAITGKRFVKVVAGGTGNVPAVSQCAAGERAVGVAAIDAATSTTVGVDRGHQNVTVTCGTAPLSAGAAVASDALGRAVVQASTAVTLGICAADTAAGADTPVILCI